MFQEKRSMNDVFVLILFINIIKDQMTLNERSINVAGRTFIHNSEWNLPER